MVTGFSGVTTRSGGGEGRGYSEYWRINKSALEPLELANALRALRKIVGYVGANVKSVEWCGMSEPEPGKLYVPPEVALGRYPIPPGRMDILVGLAASEALHCKYGSDWIWVKMADVRERLPLRHTGYLQRLVETGEDIYVDRIISGSILGDYVHKARVWRHSQSQMMAHPSIPPTAENLFHIWGRYVIDNQQYEDIHTDYLEPLGLLLSRTDEIINGGGGVSISDKISYRSKVYSELWKAIQKFFIKWDMEKIVRRVRALPTETWEYHSMGAPGGGESSPLSPRISEEVQEILASSGEDITALIRLAVKGEKIDVIPTNFRNATQSCVVVPDPHMVWKLRQVFHAQWERAMRVNRGLSSGRLDGRRLYRIPITKKVFLLKEPVLENAWSITILVDASGSMGGGKQRLAEHVCVTLAKALQGYKSRLEVFGYNEHFGVCLVYQMFRHNRLFTVPVMGRTPAGEAIIAAALKMPAGKRRLLIHITDGESNCGVGVAEAKAFCAEKNIDLITLGCGYERVSQMREQYGESLQMVRLVNQLPQVIHELLRKKLLGRRVSV